MVDILHRVGIKSSTSDVYRALTTPQGLAGWWTTDARGSFDVGGVIGFHFGTRGFFDMKVLELDPATYRDVGNADLVGNIDRPKRIVWQVVDGPQDWIGSKVSFELKQDGEQTTVLFKHAGWKEPSEFMHHCSTKWAMFLMSMKAFAETGKGAPFPDDVRITLNWD